MLISYSHKFIFIHNYKVAGTSITNTLSKYTSWYNRNKQTRLLYERLSKKVNPNHLQSHAKAIEIKDQLDPNIYDNFFKFAFVRNPWDWEVSLYNYMLRSKSHSQHDLIASMESFEEYIEWRINEAFHLQKKFVVDHNDNLIVDFIGKYENLQNDFHEICKRIGIDASLPHLNKTKHKNYREYYNDYTRELVEEAFKEDIKMLGYSFD